MRFLVRLLAACALIASSVNAQVPSPVAQPNVVIIVIDDIGWEDVALAPLPHLKGAAAFGRVYTRCYCSPTCSPTRYQALFGRLPHHAFIGTALSIVPTELGAPTSDISLPEVLQTRGYSTALFGKWHVSGGGIGQLDEAPRVQGFQTWRAGIPGNIPSNGSHYNWDRVDNGVTSHETTYSSRAIMDEFADWWPTQSGPKFAVVAFNAPHAPFESAAPSGMLPPGYTVAPGNRGFFESGLVALDTAFAEMTSFLDLSNTYVILVSDNGTPGNVKPPTLLSKGYKGTVYEGGANVPFVMWGVDTVPGVDASLIQAVDLPATVLDLVGVRSTNGFNDSITFAGTRLGQAGARPWAFVQVFAPNSGTVPTLSAEHWAVIRADGLKLLRQSGVEQLYDLSIDPFEVNDLGVTNPLYFSDVLDLDAIRAMALGTSWPY